MDRTSRLGQKTGWFHTFHCAKCGDIAATIELVDGSEHEGIRGICPEGHEQRLQD